MNKYIIRLESGHYYHLYNHAVGRENLFSTDENYYFFLEKYKEHISPFVDTFAYCLLPNHFHFAVRIKTNKEILNFISTLAKFDNDFLYTFLSKQFSIFFSSYTQAFNKQHQRKGTLFEKSFKRKYIDDEVYFRNLIHYIHFNPVHHGFVSDLQNWKYSSFKSFLSEKTTNLKKDEVINWFENKENFYLSHQKKIDEKMILELEY